MIVVPFNPALTIEVKTIEDLASQIRDVVEGLRGVQR